MDGLTNRFTNHLNRRKLIVRETKTNNGEITELLVDVERVDELENQLSGTPLEASVLNNILIQAKNEDELVCETFEPLTNRVSANLNRKRLHILDKTTEEDDITELVVEIKREDVASILQNNENNGTLLEAYNLNNIFGLKPYTISNKNFYIVKSGILNSVECNITSDSQNLYIQLPTNQNYSFVEATKSNEGTKAVKIVFNEKSVTGGMSNKAISTADYTIELYTDANHENKIGEETIRINYMYLTSVEELKLLCDSVNGVNFYISENSVGTIKIKSTTDFPIYVEALNPSSLFDIEILNNDSRLVTINVCASNSNNKTYANYYKQKFRMYLSGTDTVLNTYESWIYHNPTSTQPLD